MPRAHEEEWEDEEFEDEFDVDELVDSVFEHPRVRGVLDRVSHTLDRFGQLIDHVSTRPFAPRPRPRPQAPPPGEPRLRLDPYIILGFPRSAKLTAELVRERRKQLAKLFHPDANGSPEAMARVNQACEILLRKLQGS